MQTISFLLFKLQVSGLGSQDILSEKPWKRKKIYAGIIFTSEEKGNICFFLLFIRFRQFGAENIFISFFLIFLNVVQIQNHLKREKKTKFNFFPLTFLKFSYLK